MSLPSLLANQPIFLLTAAIALLGMMRRVAAGETRFYAPRRYEKDGAKYDEMVEHLLALSRRGMITCTEPEAGVKGVTQYADGRGRRADGCGAGFPGIEAPTSRSELNTCLLVHSMHM
jgi:hypothetical protein